MAQPAAIQRKSELVMLRHLIAEAARHDFLLLSEVTAATHNTMIKKDHAAAEEEMTRQHSQDTISNCSTTSVGDSNATDEVPSAADEEKKLSFVKRAHRLYWDSVMGDALDTYQRCCSYGSPASAYTTATEQLARRLVWRRPVSALVAAGNNVGGGSPPMDEKCRQVLDYERSIAKEPLLLHRHLQHSQLATLRQLKDGNLFTTSVST
jgi:hypothetical protein